MTIFFVILALFANFALTIYLGSSFDTKITRINQVYEGFKLNMEEVQELKHLIHVYTTQGTALDAEADKKVKTLFVKLDSAHRDYQKINPRLDQTERVLQYTVEDLRKLRVEVNRLQDRIILLEMRQELKDKTEIKKGA